MLSWKWLVRKNSNIRILLCLKVVSRSSCNIEAPGFKREIPFIISEIKDSADLKRNSRKSRNSSNSRMKPVVSEKVGWETVILNNIIKNYEKIQKNIKICKFIYIY